MRIRELRKARGLTLRQLAAAANMHASNLCHIENGHWNASVPTLERIAAALGVTVKELF